MDMPRKRRYLVSPLPFNVTDHDLNAVVVEVEPQADLKAEAQTAAKKGAEFISFDLGPDMDPNYLDTVFVMLIHINQQRAFARKPHEYKLAEYQCCGGPIPLTDNGHSGFCRRTAA